MICLANLRNIIESIVGDEAVIDKTTLLDIERELVAGNAARVAQARAAAFDGVCASIGGANA